MSKEKEKEIRSIGAEFKFSSALSEGKKKMSFVSRTKSVGVDGDDRAIYKSASEKTIMAASQLAAPFSLKKGDNFPENIEFTVLAGGKLVF